jgi:cytochrome c-type biogenesis protein CcmH/NrfG
MTALATIWRNGSRSAKRSFLIAGSSLLTVGLISFYLLSLFRNDATPATSSTTNSNSQSLRSRPSPTATPLSQSNAKPGTSESLADKIARMGKSIGLDKSPRDPDLHYKLARMLEDEGDLQGAVAEYKRATELPPKDIGSAFLYRDLGLALEK